METLKRLKQEWLIRKKERERKRKIRELQEFFQSPAGTAYMENMRGEWGFETTKDGRIDAVDNELDEYRLILPVSNEAFTGVIRERRPQKIKYRIIHYGEVALAGDLLIEATDKLALKTSGILFPQVDGIRGILDTVPEVSYTPVNKQYAGFRPWKELAREEAPSRLARPQDC